VKFVVSLAFSPPSHLCEMARAAEASGFDAVAISDHLVHPETIRTPYPYTDDGNPRWQPFTPWPDPWVAIGAMAAVTERLRFLTSVYVLPLRNPFLVAKAVATAAVMSHDRVALGIGVGWMKEEFGLLEQDFHTRGKRTNEMIEVLRKLWAGGWVEHHGTFYDFERLEMSPVPSAPVPILVGGVSTPALRRAARLGDGWISELHDTEELRDIIDTLRTYRRDSARADLPFQIFASASDAVDIDGYKRLEDAGVTHIQTFPWLFYAAGSSRTLDGTLESVTAKCDGMHRFGDDIIAKMP
jgi:probable F420-dependent oxidoreductase